MRIVFASMGSLGDLHPMLALATACREAGHEPIVAASPCYRDYLEALGFAFRAIRPDWNPPSARREYFSHPTKGPERLLREEIFPAVRETYADLLSATEGADLLVVGELLYVAPLVAAKRQLPWANVIPAPSSFLSAEDPCVLAPAPFLHGLRKWGTWPHRAVFALGKFLTKRWSAPLMELQRELGISMRQSVVFEGKFSPHGVLAMFPDFFAAPQSDWPPQVFQPGFVFFKQEISPDVRKTVDDFFRRGDPPVVFTLGSTAVHLRTDFYAQAVAAVQALGRRAILLLGKNTRPIVDEKILCLEYAPLSEVLPRAAAVVHHGGIGGCGEVLRAGVPSVVIPFGYDQPDNAERLRKLGVARALPRGKISAQALEAALGSVLTDAGMKARARTLAALIHPEEDLARAVSALERLAK